MVIGLLTQLERTRNGFFWSEDSGPKIRCRAGHLIGLGARGFIQALSRGGDGHDSGGLVLRIDIKASDGAETVFGLDVQNLTVERVNIGLGQSGPHQGHENQKDVFHHRLQFKRSVKSAANLEQECFLDQLKLKAQAAKNSFRRQSKSRKDRAPKGADSPNPKLASFSKRLKLCV
jgi:hypothetical protein